ncbi:MAG: dihydroorotase [Opitutales bacterium]
MSEAVWIRNARVVDPVTGRDAPGELFLRDGIFVDALSDAEKAAAQEVDAGGRVACPGFIDLHCHLREPGDKHKETIASGSRAAAAGGFTTIVATSNTKPPVDNAGTLQLLKDAITRHAVVRVLPTGCLTVGRAGETLAPMGTLKNGGVYAVSDSGHCVQDNELMRRAVEYARMCGLVVFDRPEDASQTAGCQMNEGTWSLRLGLRGMHSSAENVMLARDLIFSDHFDARIHLHSVSNRWAVDALKRSRSRNVPITADVTPHHLSLTDAALASYDTNFKTVPPLRDEHDRQALIAGLCDGTIDAIATAHAPHTVMEKDQEFDDAPFGVLGLETALPMCLQTLVETGALGLPGMLACLTVRAASVLGLPFGTLQLGASADVVLFDPQALWTVQRETLCSRSHNSPWLGQQLRGRVWRTYCRGQLVYDSERREALTTSE